MLNARCGCSADLSLGVVDRAMFHAANAYWLPTCAIASRRLKTNTVSNTAFRGFGGPQGMIAIERVMDAIARERGLDPLDVRKANFYRPGGDRTPYDQTVEDLETLPAMIAELEASSDYRARRAAIAAFNATSPILKRGIALTPVKFGISFTLIHLNQAGALVHVYTDGSIHLNHGGTEMGQGLFTKVAQVVAEEFGVPLDFVRITATNTAKVPNASPTAASSGSDINGMAAQDRGRPDPGAHGRLRGRAMGRRAGEDRVPRRARVRRQQVDVFRRARQGLPAQPRRNSRRPAITRRRRSHWDRADGEGQAVPLFRLRRRCAEVAIDTLTGEMKVLARRHPPRRRLLAQSGARHRPGRGRLRPGHGLADDGGTGVRRQGAADAPTRRRPTRSRSPPTCRRALRTRLHMRPNTTDSIYRSKAVGEPPLMLASRSIARSSTRCTRSSRDGQPKLEAPCTPEAILNAIASLNGAG